MQQIRLDDNEGNTIRIVQRGRPSKPPAQSKGDPKQVRFYPDKERDIQRACRAERCSFTEFIEKVSDVGIEFSFEQIDVLLTNKDLIHFITSNRSVRDSLRSIIAAAQAPVSNTGVEMG